MERFTHREILELGARGMEVEELREAMIKSLYGLTVGMAGRMNDLDEIKGAWVGLRELCRAEAGELAAKYGEACEARLASLEAEQSGPAPAGLFQSEH